VYGRIFQGLEVLGISEAQLLFGRGCSVFIFHLWRVFWSRRRKSTLLRGRCSYREVSHVGDIISYSSGKSQVRVTSGNFSLDVVTLAEECEPIIENLYVFWFEILPLWSAFLLLQGRLCESSGCVFAGKDCDGELMWASLVDMCSREIYLSMKLLVRMLCCRSRRRRFPVTCQL
jgi:hypothetical protein